MIIKEIFNNKIINLRVPTIEGWVTVSEFVAKHNTLKTRRGLPYGIRYVYEKIKENEENDLERKIYNNGVLWFEYQIIGEQKNFLIKIK